MTTKPPSPPAEKAPPKPPADQTAGVRRQRRHIKELTGEDPLRGGVAD
ncbi:hypothetical protein [uncultured Caulobacter sp.]|nr:hypothetical protein [uncultured Caulobacter sp.]